uniref:Uncharacterized protein n=1 Tax=Phlebotomus papatasi TaxID=29031 RepID=A0A1B0D247_PHLPP
MDDDWTVCRLCLQSNEGNMKSLPDVTYNMIPFFNIYFELVGITFTDYPTFPGKICSSCEEQMHQAYKFREKCLETEEKLKELLNEETTALNIEFIPTPKATESPFKIAAKDVTSNTEIQEITNNSSTAKGTTNKSCPSKEDIQKKSSSHKKSSSEKRTSLKSLQSKSIQCKSCRRIFQGIELFKKHSCCFSDQNHQNQEEKSLETSTATKPKRQKSQIKKTYECEECNKKYLCQNSFMIHMDKHKNIQRYECYQCDKKFAHWIQKRKHVYKVHLKTAFCECNECGKGFYKIYDLKQHINSEHLKYFPFQCELCGKTFKQKFTLSNHMKLIHTTQTVTCKKCGKKLKNKRTLKHHMKTHRDEKNYVCPVCSRAFTCNFSLKGHVRKQHPDKVHLLPPDGTIVNKAFLKKMAEADE